MGPSYAISYSVLAGTRGNVSERLGAYLGKIWATFPDLQRVHETHLTAWSFGAVRWRALGFHRSAYGNIPPSMRPVFLRREAIMRFDANGDIAEIWIDDASAASAHQSKGYQLRH